MTGSLQRPIFTKTRNQLSSYHTRGIGSPWWPKSELQHQAAHTHLPKTRAPKQAPKTIPSKKAGRPDQHRAPQAADTCAIVDARGVPHRLLQVDSYFRHSRGQLWGDHCGHQVFCFLIAQETQRDGSRLGSIQVDRHPGAASGWGPGCHAGQPCALL